jgi:hypothetical protein
MKGEGRRPSDASIQLLVRGEGWPTTVHDMVMPARGCGGSAKRRREMVSSMGHLGPKWAERPGD